MKIFGVCVLKMKPSYKKIKKISIAKPIEGNVVVISSAGKRENYISMVLAEALH